MNLLYFLLIGASNQAPFYGIPGNLTEIAKMNKKDMGREAHKILGELHANGGLKVKENDAKDNHVRSKYHGEIESTITDSLEPLYTYKEGHGDVIFLGSS